MLVLRLRLDDDGALADTSLLLGRLDHGEADAVLDAAERIERLQLGDDSGIEAGGELVEPHQWRVADQLSDIVSYPGHRVLPGSG
jgi:hypothetical protein